jgi:hypothetical protein
MLPNLALTLVMNCTNVALNPKPERKNQKVLKLEKIEHDGGNVQIIAMRFSCYKICLFFVILDYHFLGILGICLMCLVIFLVHLVVFSTPPN